MNTRKTYKRFKRRFRKKLYYFLLKVSNMDFSRLRPLLYLTLIAAMFLALAKLPTYETDNRACLPAMQGAELAAAIRSLSSDNNACSADVIALFSSENPSDETVADNEPLYSFYLTGRELSYLAEGAVTTASRTSSVYLDGLNYTYHKNRLPFNRVTSLTLSSGAGLTDNLLYHVISTEDIFSLFHYISYRSLGIMHIRPKDAAGNLLSDYQKVILTETGTPLTIHAVKEAVQTTSSKASAPVSVVIRQHGFNLIDLIKEPNKITLCVCALFLALAALLWYIVPRLHRIRIWFRIYRIRSRKRSSHTLYGFKKRY